MKNSLIFSSLLASLFAYPASAKAQTTPTNIPIQGVSPAGTTYRVEYFENFNQQNGWTIFDYIERQADGSEEKINATTPYCFRQSIQRHPRAIRPQTVPSAGWLVVGENTLNVVLVGTNTANRNLLRTICNLSN